MTLMVETAGWDVEPWLARFRALLPDRDVVAADGPYDPVAILYTATWKHRPGRLAELPNLRVMFSLGAGVDHLFADPALPGLPIVRAVDDDLTARMSEYVVLHCLAQLRGMRVYERQQRERVWANRKDQPAAREVRVGVMGLGILGSDAAVKLATMGFDVAGWSRTPRSLPGIATFSGEAGLPAFLGRTDILVVLLPLTDATRGILDGALFARLARDGRLGAPILLNAGRGGLQVEADILSSLDEGVLGHAVLDVFETEPLPAASPLWSHPGVTVTPHNSAISSTDAIAACIARHIRAHEAGEPLPAVDRAAGY